MYYKTSIPCQVENSEYLDWTPLQQRRAPPDTAFAAFCSSAPREVKNGLLRTPYSSGGATCESMPGSGLLDGSVLRCRQLPRKTTMFLSAGWDPGMRRDAFELALLSRAHTRSTVICGLQIRYAAARSAQTDCKTLSGIVELSAGDSGLQELAVCSSIVTMVTRLPLRWCAGAPALRSNSPCGGYDGHRSRLVGIRHCSYDWSGLGEGFVESGSCRT